MKKWKNLPTWLKGGIIGVIIGVLVSSPLLSLFIFDNWPFPIHPLSLFAIVFFLAWPYSFLLRSLNLEKGSYLSFLDYLLSGYGEVIIYSFFSIINLFLLGALIGWLIGKRKSKPEKQNSTPAS